MMAPMDPSSPEPAHRPNDDVLRVAYTVEQCWHPSPGGTAIAALRIARELRDAPRGRGPAPGGRQTSGCPGGRVPTGRCRGHAADREAAALRDVDPPELAEGRSGGRRDRCRPRHRPRPVRYVGTTRGDGARSRLRTRPRQVLAARRPHDDPQPRRHPPPGRPRDLFERGDHARLRRRRPGIVATPARSARRRHRRGHRRRHRTGAAPLPPARRLRALRRHDRTPQEPGATGGGDAAPGDARPFGRGGRRGLGRRRRRHRWRHAVPWLHPRRRPCAALRRTDRRRAHVARAADPARRRRAPRWRDDAARGRRRPIVLTVHDLQYLTFPRYFSPCPACLPRCDDATVGRTGLGRDGARPSTCAAPSSTRSVSTRRASWSSRTASPPCSTPRPTISPRSAVVPASAIGRTSCIPAITHPTRGTGSSSRCSITSMRTCSSCCSAATGAAESAVRSAVDSSVARRRSAPARSRPRPRARRVARPCRGARVPERVRGVRRAARRGDGARHAGRVQRGAGGRPRWSPTRRSCVGRPTGAAWAEAVTEARERRHELAARAMPAVPTSRSRGRAQRSPPPIDWRRRAGVHREDRRPVPALRARHRADGHGDDPHRRGARGLGHELHVVTSLPWYRDPPDRARMGRAVGSAPRRRRGGAITRVHPFPGTDKRNLLRRALGFVGFSALSLVGALRAGGRGRPDAVLAMSPPLTLGPTGWLVGVGCGGPRSCSTSRTCSPTPRSDRSDHEPTRHRGASWLERWSYHRAAAVTVLSDDLPPTSAPRWPPFGTATRCT
jgi:hypothetical protein